MGGNVYGKLSSCEDRSSANSISPRRKRRSGRAAVSGGGAMKRAALYARVSTDKQEREETIASQLDALSHAVAAGAYEIPPGGEFVDEHARGARRDRPALDRVRALAAAGVLEAGLVWSPDRLARRYA